MTSAFLRFCFSLCLTALVLTDRPARADDGDAPSRVTIYLSSADDIIADLEHLVVDMAEEPDAWEESVFPNIDIFLIGVDWTRPIHFDQVFDAEHGQRPQFSIPVADLDEFILDNLDPLGIIVTPVRRQNDYYELTDVYEGWMRIVDNYAVFGEHEGDVPKDLMSPAEANEQLLSRGYDVGVQLNNALTALDDRTAAFATFRENTMAAVKKRPQETNEAFALRELTTGQNLEIFERVFVQSSEITIGMIIDSEQDAGRGEFLLTAVPDSDLAATLQLQAQDHSYFARIESNEGATLSGRVNFAFDELLQRQADELYPAMRPVMTQKIDDDETLSDEQKAARTEITGIVLDMLAAGGELGMLDAAIEINPDGAGGTHTMVAGIRVTDGAPVERVLELLPQSSASLQTELNVDEAGDVKIHRLTVSGERYPQGLAEFFGDSGEFFIGTGPDAVWMSGGAGGLEQLKAAIAAVAEAPEGDVDPTIARLDLELLPLLRMMKSLRDEGRLDLMNLFGSGEEEAPPEGEETDEESTASMLKDFEWRETAIEALSGEEGRLHMEIHREEDHLEGTSSVEQGILKAVGELIAKFAKDNLG